MESKTDIELKKEVESAIDAALAPMHELQRRGYVVKIDTVDISSVAAPTITIFKLSVTKTTEI